MRGDVQLGLKITMFKQMGRLIKVYAFAELFQKPWSETKI